MDLKKYNLIYKYFLVKKELSKALEEMMVDKDDVKVAIQHQGELFKIKLNASNPTIASYLRISLLKLQSIIADATESKVELKIG